MTEEKKGSSLELNLLQQAEKAKLWNLLKKYRQCTIINTLQNEAERVKKYAQETSLPKEIYIEEVKSSLRSILDDASKNPEKDYADHALHLAKAFGIQD